MVDRNIYVCHTFYRVDRPIIVIFDDMVWSALR